MKKAKRPLSLSLAIVTAFTATLSSTASADSIDNVENPDENLPFGCIILDKMKNDTSNDNVNPDSEISPLWTGDVHDEIISNVDYNYIPAQYEDLVYKICRWCDDETKIYFSTCIHGNRNYAASLKFLWKYAHVIGDKNITGTYSQLSANAKKVSLAQFDNKLIKNNKTDYEGLLDLATRTEAIINTYGKTKTPEARKYMIFGVILHLLGDVTAHRTVVPQFLVDRATNPIYVNNKNRFDKSDFSTVEWNRIKSLVNAKKLDFTSISSTYSEKNTNFVLDSNITDNGRISELRKRYEDNPNVIPNRILASETMAEYFLRTFNSGFNISILDNIPYSNIDLIFYSRYHNEG